MAKLIDISHSFGDKIVINRLSLDLSIAQITALVGPSGCGKSTLLRIIAGLIIADKGKITLKPSDVAFIFQEPRLLPWLTVGENLSLALPAFKENNSLKIKEILRKVHLENIVAAMPHELSGGMAQRVGICRALLKQTTWLLLDEPFAALDAITRADLQQMLLHLAKEQALNCIFVTHDLDEAVLISDQLAVMIDGRITALYKKHKGQYPSQIKPEVCTLLQRHY